MKAEHLEERKLVIEKVGGVERSANGLIIDTCVLLDILISSRARHEEAQKLADYLHTSDRTAEVPIHAVFEIRSGWKNEEMQASPKALPVSTRHIKETPFQIVTIDIDQEFIDEYYRPDLPYLKAGDMIFVAMAKGDGKPLITEDEEMYKKAQTFDVEVYKIQEFLDRLNQR